MYGNDPNPGGLHDAYHQLVCGDWWDEDPYSPRYNRFVHVPCGTTPPFASWSEALWTETAAYPYLAVINFNDNPTIGGERRPDRGSSCTPGWTARPQDASPSRCRTCSRCCAGSSPPITRSSRSAPTPRSAASRRAPPIGFSVAAASPAGYWLASSAGNVLAFGGAARWGSPLGSGDPLAAPVTSIASAPGGGGYWVTTGNGHVYQYGKARFFGSPFKEGRRLHLVGIAPVPSGNGYVVVADNGGVEAFGQARSYGSPLSSGHPTRIVAIASTPDGKGYWLLAADGSVDHYGDARGYGSPAASHQVPRSPLVGIVATRDGRGYWLTTAAGEVLPYGDARSYGSPAGHLMAPVVGITAFAGGYELYAVRPSLPARPHVYRYRAPG